MMNSGEVVFILYCIVFLILFFDSLLRIKAELSTYKRRRTPTLLYASSFAGLVICSLLIFFEFLLNLSLSLGHILLTENHNLKSDDSLRTLYFVLGIAHACVPFLLLTSWRYLEITALELFSVPAHELVALNEKYGAEMRRLPELPRAIYVGHLISWFIASILFIIGLADVIKYHEFKLSEEHYIVYYKKIFPVWGLVPIIITTILMVIIGVFLALFSCIKMRDASTSVSWVVYSAMGSSLAFGALIGIILNGPQTQISLWLGNGGELVTFICLLVCERLLAKIRDTPQRHHRTERTSDVFDQKI